MQVDCCIFVETENHGIEIFQESAKTFLNKTWEWLKEVSLKSHLLFVDGVGMIGIGILILPVYPSVTLPFIGIGVGIIASTLFKFPVEDRISQLVGRVKDFENSYICLKIIAVISTIYMGCFFAPAGICASFAIGFFEGLVADQKILERQRKNNKKNMDLNAAQA